MRFLKVKNTKLDIDYGWLLSLESPEDVQTYLKEFISFNMPNVLKEGRKIISGVGHYTHHHTHPVAMSMQSIIQQKGECSVVEGAISFYTQIEICMKQLITQYDALLTNKLGGYFPINFTDPNYVIYQSVTTTTMQFPEYTEKDIEIKQWDFGKHYYAFIGSIEVNVDGVKKWNTYDMAKARARLFLEQMNQ